METLKDDPIFVAEFQGGTNGIGLTKREYMATQIAIGLSVKAIAGRHNMAEPMSKDVPRTAVMIADALIDELNKKE